LHDELSGIGIEKSVMPLGFGALELGAALKSAPLSAKLAELVG
jgi:hypothetical protein